MIIRYNHFGKFAFASELTLAETKTFVLDSRNFFNDLLIGDNPSGQCRSKDLSNLGTLREALIIVGSPFLNCTSSVVILAVYIILLRHPAL